MSEVNENKGDSGQEANAIAVALLQSLAPVLKEV
jgi:hypothetical protein